MSHNTELVEYYKNLLIIQYRNKPNACATIAANAESAMIFDVAKAVKDAFDIETAVGAQLDLIGKYLGADRIVTGDSFTRAYFGFSEYGAYDFDFSGYIKYDDEIPDIQYRSYKESKQSLYSLNDAEYRIILKLKIIQNNGIPSVKNIDEIMSVLFGDNVIFTDRQNMTISYIFNEGQERIATIAQSSDVLPRPSGVGMSLSFTKNINAMFAYGQYGGMVPDFALGYSEYGDTDITGGWSHYG